MSQKIDACGLSCPQPVLLVDRAIANADFPVEVTVDTVTAVENVRRLAENRSCRVTVEEKEDGFELLIEQ